MVVEELVGNIGREVLDQVGGKVEDGGTEDGGVRNGAGVAGREGSGDVLHRVVLGNERLWSDDGLKWSRHCSYKYRCDTIALAKLPTAASLVLCASALGGEA